MDNDTFPCPNCGFEVPDGALSCPECGSDEETGWSETAYVGGLDLPENDWPEDEWPDDPAADRESGGILPRVVVVVFALLLVVAFLLMSF